MSLIVCGTKWKICIKYFCYIMKCNECFKGKAIMQLCELQTELVTFFIEHVCLEEWLADKPGFFFFFFFLNIPAFYLFIYFWLCWVFVSVWGLSLVVASGGHSSSRCAGLSLSRPLPLQSTGSSRAGSAVVAHGPSRSAACGIFPDQGSNPCPLHWQADSQPLCHQGSPNQGSSDLSVWQKTNSTCYC